MKKSSSRSVLTVLLAGVVAGTLDIIAAIIGAPPMAVFRYIASGVFGSDAFSGGTPMAIYGLIFHYLIAIIWALIFFLIYPHVKIMRKNKYVTGLVYGIVVWFVMNVIVLPFSNIPPGGVIRFPGAFINMGILMIAVGLPISLIVHRHYK